MNKNIAVLYICTGKYEMFWDRFYETCEKYFYPNDKKEYFVFTDCNRIITEKKDRVHTYYQHKSGWPYDTLMRYQWFCTIQDKIMGYDFAYYMNANTVFLREVTEEKIPYPCEKEPLVISLHSKYYDDTDGSRCHPERNPESTACVPDGTPCRAHCGAFWGGTSDAVMTMCRVLRDRTMTDMQNGIIAVWHDQSHLIKYATEVPHHNIGKYLLSYEENADLDKALAIFVAKSKYGGNDKLREVSFRERLKHFPKKVYSKMLKVLSYIKLDNAFRKITHLGKNKK